MCRLIAWLALLASFSAVPAAAGELRPEEAKRFVAGKLFAYTCFDGTSGTGRIYPDGSVAGTLQSRGSRNARFVSLPPGTIRVKQASLCATLRGMPFEPCFKVVQTSNRSFRGWISGLSFAYCDFIHRNPRLELAASTNPRPPVQPAAMTPSPAK